VANEIQYKPYIHARLSIEGRNSISKDLWMEPSLTKQVGVGNCANKSFLLTSLLRNEFGPDQVFTVLGNLYNGHAGGHAWVQLNLNGQEFIVESTRGDVMTFFPVICATRYEAVHLFNDETSMAVPGKTIMEPFSACYSTWLKHYIDSAYVESGGRY
jgi:hypothetical protein